MVSEREQTAELRAKLSSGVQEKLTAERERERLELETQHLKEQLKWHQEQLSAAKEALISRQTPEQPTDYVESRISPVERSKDKCLDQVTGLGVAKRNRCEVSCAAVKFVTSSEMGWNSKP